MELAKTLCRTHPGVGGKPDRLLRYLYMENQLA